MSKSRMKLTWIKRWMYALLFFDSLVSISFAASVFTWPMYEKNPTLEIRSLDASSGVTECLAKSYIVHPRMPYGTTAFQGNSKSYVGLRVSNDTAFQDFSMSATVAPTSLTGGTIFHYESDSIGEPESITGILLYYNTSGIFVNIYGPKGTEQGMIKASGVVPAINTWTTFILQYDISGPSMILITNISNPDGEELGTVDLMYGKPPITLPGTLRIGGAIDMVDKSTFRGQIACVSMYSTKLNKGNIPDTILQCTDVSAWINVSTPTSAGSNSGDCPDYSGMYVLRLANARLSNTVMELTSVTAQSRVRCADLCSQHGACYSFTFDTVTRMCKLYDMDYSLDLVKASTTSYYMRR